VLWDALIDPWIGVYSDNHYKKYGDRKRIIYFAVMASVFLFFFMWRIPHMGEWPTFFALFVISSLLNSAISLFSVPYIAVANDLEHDNEKRKVWTGWRLAFFNLGSFLGLVVPAYFLTKAASFTKAQEAAGLTVNVDASLPYKHATLILSAVMIICSVCSIFYVYRHLKPQIIDTANDVKFKLLDLMRDPKFLRMMISFFIFNCGLGLNSALALYYYKDYLGFVEQQTQSILVGFLVVFTLSIPFWVLLTRKYDKQKLIMLGGLGLGLMTVLGFPNFQGVDFWIIFVTAAVVGGVLVGVAVVLEIYLSDFLKDKEIETKQNVSGQYLGVWKMSSKVSRAVAIALAGPILEQAADKQILANYFGWGVGLFFIAGALIIAVPLNFFKSK
jgi:GPH family glycoside/pentoside/hexuronide:cation symporter